MDFFFDHEIIRLFETNERKERIKFFGVQGMTKTKRTEKNRITVKLGRKHVFERPKKSF